MGARRLLFVYGEHDPWSAEWFHLGDGSRDSYRLTAAGGGHRTSLEDRIPTEHARAVAAIQRWAGVTQHWARHIGALDDMQPTSVDEHGGVRRFFVRDPDGVVVSVLAHD